MREAVRAAFVPFSAPLEGVVPFLYLDVKGLVTTAIGVLVDPMVLAMPLPWRHADGAPATQAEIAVEWARVKARQDLKLRGGMAFRSVTTLRLTDEGVELVTLRKLGLIWTHLVGRFPDAIMWPADAQLALLSHAWAVGPAFQWPMLMAALRASDFALAAAESKLKEHENPGVRPRNQRNRVLWRNAAHVVRHGLDPDVLYWPRDLADEAATDPAVAVEAGPPSEPTQPSSRATLPWAGEIGDDIADAALDDISKRHGDG